MRIMRLNPGRQIGLVGLVLLALAITIGAGSISKANAAPVNLTFDNGRLTIGSLFDNRIVLPADDRFPSEDLPAPQRTDLQLIGDLAGDKLTIPAAANSGLQFPYMHLMHPLEPGLKIPVTMRLNNPGLTGTWNEATGAMTLAGKIDLIVITGTGTNFPIPDSFDDLGAPPLGLFARCRVNDLPVNFTTERTFPTVAQPFTGGFGKKGALTTRWDALPAATPENGGDCAQLNILINVAGGLWLANGIVDPIPPKGPDKNCESDVSLCPPPRYTEIDRVKLRPGKKTVRRGQKLVLTVKVHNSGNIAARNLKVRLRSTNKAFKLPKKIRMTVPARGSAKKKFKVRIKRNARGRGRIVAASNGWAGRTYLKVKPGKIRKR